MASGSAVQTKGLGLWLCSARYRLIAAWRSTSEWNTPRRRRRLESSGKEPLDRVEPRGRGRREVEGPARVPSEPCPHLGVLVTAVVVEHDMDQLAGRDVTLETVEEANELLVAVTLHALPDHRAVEYVHGGEQRRRAVADVVVRHRAGPSRPFLKRCEEGWPAPAGHLTPSRSWRSVMRRPEMATALRELIGVAWEFLQDCTLSGLEGLCVESVGA